MNTSNDDRLPPGTGSGHRQDDSELNTERARERREENEEFVPVILKRTDEAVRHPDDVLETVIKEGLEQLERPFLSLALSSVAAGLILGFTAMPVAILSNDPVSFGAPLLQRLAVAAVYPIGFILCIMSGTQLFTEHTATAVYPVLDRRASGRQLARLWSTVILGNLLGTLIIAGMLTFSDSVIQARQGYLLVAQHLVVFNSPPMLASAILAGWLMALGAWLVMATPPTISQIICVYIVTFLIGLAGLHHSIAGSVELFTAELLTGAFDLATILKFLALAVFGNMIGGSIFVAALNYGHIRQTQHIELPDQPNSAREKHE